MRTPAILAAALSATVLVTTGCATEPVAQRKEVSFDAAAANPLIPSNYAAADSLLAQLRGQLAPAQALIAATVVNIDALEQSSTLGRLISEQVSARFTLAGYRMIEMKFRNNVYMARDQGELMLTREIRDLASSHDAQAVVVGTYAVSASALYITLKLVNPVGNTAVAAHNYAVPMDEDVRALLVGR